MKRVRFFPTAFQRELSPGRPDTSRLAADLIPEHHRCASAAPRTLGLPADHDTNPEGAVDDTNPKGTAGSRSRRLSLTSRQLEE